LCSASVLDAWCCLNLYVKDSACIATQRENAECDPGLAGKVWCAVCDKGRQTAGQKTQGNV